MSTCKDILVGLGQQKAGALMLLAALVFGWTSHILFEGFVGDMTSYEPRLLAIEAHDQAMLDSLDSRWLGQLDAVDSLKAQLFNIEFMVHQLFCDKWPDQCTQRPLIGGGEDEEDRH